MGASQRIIVLRALGLGDLLTAVPALRGLRRAFPQARITLAAPAWLAAVAELTGAVDELADTAPLAPLDPRLSGADLAVNLHGRGPQSTALLAATRPARLLAYGPTWREDEHEVTRWCRLLAEAGLPADPADLDLPVPDVAPARTGAVLVHPGSAAASRRWPVERWAEVVRQLPDVVITAGPGERERAQAVARAAGRGEVLAGQSLPELVALVAASRLLLASDTGVAHLATAVGTPSVVLFGPVPPARWGPPPGRPQHVALWGGMLSANDSAGPAPGLLALTPADVLDAARELLDPAPT